jgi:hypothetical protein
VPQEVNPVFELDSFISECHAALSQDPSLNSIREITARAVSDPAAILKGLGEPTRAGIQTLSRLDSLTILNVVWGPHMTLFPTITRCGP